MSQFYTKGTIKIKNADGVLEPFYPKTDLSSVKNDDTTLSETLTNLNTRITEASQKGGIKVMYEEPTAENTAQFANKTLIGYVVPIPEIWSYTVDTRKYDNTETNAKTSIPFNLYNVNDASITVDWGDNTTNTYTKSDYSLYTPLNNTSSTGLIHTYSEPGIYTVKVISNNFDKVKLYNDFSASANTPIYYYRNTLTQVNNAFPTLNLTNFAYCFCKCTSLTTLPENLFEYYTDVTNFNYCFYGCSSLTSIPTNLFRYNTAVTNFSSCFYYCSSLATIPTDLFKYNTAVTSFENCFIYCEALNDFAIHIGSPNVTSVSSFIAYKAGTTRIVYVPQGSTTQTTFNNNSSVTVIGE